jgi:hypothetical protein
MRSGLDVTPGAGALPSRQRPLPAELGVEQARDAYLAENGFTLAGYEAPRTEASLLGIAFSVPNTPHHAWAIRLHDLHHVATGFGTDHAGEAEISAWEARRGLRALGLYVGSIVVAGALFGLLVAPRRTLRAWRVSGRARSLFNDDRLSYEALLALSVGELRQQLGLPRDGLATQPRALHGLAAKATDSRLNPPAPA